MDYSKHDKPLGANTGRLLRGLDQSMTAFQWVRELLTNAKDAGALKAMFGLTTVFGVLKRFVIDDGAGMLSFSADGLLDAEGKAVDASGFRDMSELFDLGESVDEEEHFGVGAKGSLLGWNSFGLLYLSRARTASGHLVESVAWLHIAEGDPKLRAMPVGDGGYDTCPALGLFENGAWVRDQTTASWLVSELDGSEPWSLFEAQQSGQRIVSEDGTGTVVLLLGMKPEDATDDGNPNFPSEGSSERGIVRYLNGRYVDLTESFDVVGQQYVAQKDGKIKFRSATGLVPQLEVYSQNRELLIPEPVKLSDGTVLQFYVDKGAVEREADGAKLEPREGNVQPSGRVFVAFRDEIYVDLPARLSRWGIGKPKVAKHSWLVITPPDGIDNPSYGAKPDQARRGLVMVGTDDGSLPELEWQDEVRGKLPSEITKLMEEVSLGGPDDDLRASIRKSVMDHVHQLIEQDFRDEMLEVHPDGETSATATVDTGGAGQPDHVPGDGGGGGGGAKDGGQGGSTEQAEADPGGADLAKRRRRKSGPPEIELVDELEDDTGAIVELAAMGDKVVLNVDITHEYVKREVAHWTSKEEYDHLDEDELIAPTVQYAIGGMALWAYGRLTNDITVDKAGKRVGSDLLSPQALSLAARVPVYSIVKPRLDARK